MEVELPPAVLDLAREEQESEQAVQHLELQEEKEKEKEREKDVYEGKEDKEEDDE